MFSSEIAKLRKELHKADGEWLHCGDQERRRLRR